MTGSGSWTQDARVRALIAGCCALVLLIGGLALVGRGAPPPLTRAIAGAPSFGYPPAPLPSEIFGVAPDYEQPSVPPPATRVLSAAEERASPPPTPDEVAHRSGRSEKKSQSGIGSPHVVDLPDAGAVDDTAEGLADAIDRDSGGTLGRALNSGY
jgi:hypothetical protein